MTTKEKPTRPDDRLVALADLYRQRNAVYGDTWRDFGKIMRGFFPGPLLIDSEDAWNRLGLFFHIADKTGRYARQFSQGGHVDSLDDISVYAQLLQAFDAEAVTRRPPSLSATLLRVDE